MPDVPAPGKTAGLQVLTSAMPAGQVPGNGALPAGQSGGCVGDIGDSGGWNLAYTSMATLPSGRPTKLSPLDEDRE